MPMILRLDDPGSHGGKMISAASRTKAEGKPICRVGDTYNCHEHGPNPLTKIGAATRTKCEGPLVAMHGTKADCGAIMAATADRTMVE